MIPYDVTYRRADTIDEAIQAWRDAEREEMRAAYFGGGTEIVTLARENKFAADVFIDYKRIPELRRFPSGGGRGGEPDAKSGGVDGASWGSAVRLNEIVDAGGSNILARCCAGIADRTVRNSITLGGNICGMLPYREAILPFLLLDGSVDTVGPEMKRARTPVLEKFAKKMQLERGEFVLSFHLDQDVLEGIESNGITISDRGWGPVEAWAAGPRGAWFYSRRTRESRVDYPLVTLTLARMDGEYRLALTGAFGYPLRAIKAEKVLNDEIRDQAPAKKNGADGRAVRHVRHIAERALDAEDLRYKGDMRGSSSYRREMAIQSLAAGLERI